MQLSRRDRRSDGFTLIEMMIVVAIIGLLAVMAIPNYLTMQCKAKRSEAKMQLGGIFSAEKMFFSEYNFLTTDLAVMDWAPQQTPLYIYGFDSSVASPSPPKDLGNGEIADGTNSNTAVPAVYDANGSGTTDGPQDFDTSKMVDFNGVAWTGANLNPICVFTSGALRICAYGNLDSDAGVDDLYLDPQRSVIVLASDC